MERWRSRRFTYRHSIGYDMQLTMLEVSAWSGAGMGTGLITGLILRRWLG